MERFDKILIRGTVAAVIVVTLTALAWEGQGNPGIWEDLQVLGTVLSFPAGVVALVGLLWAWRDVAPHGRMPGAVDVSVWQRVKWHWSGRCDVCGSDPEQESNGHEIFSRCPQCGHGWVDVDG